MLAKESEPLQMSEAEYLEFEADSDIHHEYVNGDVFAMTGASVRHNLIINNTSNTLMNQLAQKDCIVLSNDTRVRVDSKLSYRYPDVTVICGKVQYAAKRVDTVSNPIVLIEVLSPSTAPVDRNQKLDEYTRIISLQEYVMISQDETKIERFLRQESGDWLYSKAIRLDSEMNLPSIGCNLQLVDIYNKLELTDNFGDTM